MTADHGIAEQQLQEAETALRKGVGVFVSGPPGSGRQVVLQALEARFPAALVLDLRSLRDADAPAVAVLEARAALSLSDEAVLDQDGLFEGARQIATLLDRADRLLVLRVPGDWWRIARADESDDRVLAMGEAVLRGLTSTRGPLAVIADEGADRRKFLPGKPCVVELPLRRVTFDHLEAVTAWGSLRAHAERLGAHAASAACSMVSWRLAVGLVATGEAVETVLAQLQTDDRVSVMTRLLARRMAQSQPGQQVLERVAALRVPVRRALLPEVLGVTAPWSDLAAECLGYGGAEVRVPSEVRAVCERFVADRGGVPPEAHHALAEYHRGLDGATAPKGLSQSGVRQWAEKVHHLGASGPLGFDAWRAQTMPGPQFYWDRGRALSWRRDYAAAATTYRDCVARFPHDDYGWHYLAYHLEHAGVASASIETAFRKARTLAPRNPWWNGRLVSYLIRSGKPAEARAAWQEALRSVLTAEDGPCRDAITAMELHRWVAKTWLEAGRPSEARDVLRGIDPEVLRAESALSELVGQAEAGCENGGPTWLGVLNADTTGRLRCFWHALRAQVGERLPLPIVEHIAGDLRCTWSYARLRVQADLYDDGTVGWYARETASAASEAGDDDINAPGAALVFWVQRAADG